MWRWILAVGLLSVFLPGITLVLAYDYSTHLCETSPDTDIDGYYCVQAGDTLREIYQEKVQGKWTYQEFKSENSIPPDESTIYVNQMLQIRPETAVSAASSSTLVGPNHPEDDVVKQEIEDESIIKAYKGGPYQDNIPFCTFLHWNIQSNAVSETREGFVITDEEELVYSTENGVESSRELPFNKFIGGETDALTEEQQSSLNGFLKDVYEEHDIAIRLLLESEKNLGSQATKEFYSPENCLDAVGSPDKNALFYLDPESSELAVHTGPVAASKIRDALKGKFSLEGKEGEAMVETLKNMFKTVETVLSEGGKGESERYGIVFMASEKSSEVLWEETLKRLKPRLEQSDYETTYLVDQKVAQPLTGLRNEKPTERNLYGELERLSQTVDQNDKVYIVLLSYESCSENNWGLRTGRGGEIQKAELLQNINNLAKQVPYGNVLVNTQTCSPINPLQGLVFGDRGMKRNLFSMAAPGTVTVRQDATATRQSKGLEDINRWSNAAEVTWWAVEGAKEYIVGIPERVGRLGGDGAYFLHVLMTDGPRFARHIDFCNNPRLTQEERKQCQNEGIVETHWTATFDLIDMVALGTSKPASTAVKSVTKKGKEWIAKLTSEATDRVSVRKLRSREVKRLTEDASTLKMSQVAWHPGKAAQTAAQTSSRANVGKKAKQDFLRLYGDKSKSYIVNRIQGIFNDFHEARQTKIETRITRRAEDTWWNSIRSILGLEKSKQQRREVLERTENLHLTKGEARKIVDRWENHLKSTQVFYKPTWWADKVYSRDMSTAGGAFNPGYTITRTHSQDSWTEAIRYDRFEKVRASNQPGGILWISSDDDSFPAYTRYVHELSHASTVTNSIPKTVMERLMLTNPVIHRTEPVQQFVDHYIPARQRILAGNKDVLHPRQDPEDFFTVSEVQARLNELRMSIDPDNPLRRFSRQEVLTEVRTNPRFQKNGFPVILDELRSSPPTETSRSINPSSWDKYASLADLLNKMYVQVGGAAVAYQTYEWDPVNTQK